MSPAPSLSVAILTYNGEKYLRQVFDSLHNQVFEGELEILVIDSGSTDGTLNIVRDYPAVKLHEIPNSEFGHGRTRNLAANLCSGTVIAFLTQDAIPDNMHWAAAITEPFALHPKIVAVLGKQVPRKNGVPFIRYEIEKAFRLQGSDEGVTIFGASPSIMRPESFQIASFYSDVNSAALREFLVTEISYRDVRYAEDRLFAEDLLSEGYFKAYAPKASVEHSNDLSFREIGPRTFDEVIGLREIGTVLPRFGTFSALLRALKESLLDLRRIAFKRGDSTFWYRVKWVFLDPWYQASRWLGFSKASRADLDDKGIIAKYSLEFSRKRSSSRKTDRLTGSAGNG